MRAIGEPAPADAWIREHAAKNGIGDAHYQGDAPSTEYRSSR